MNDWQHWGQQHNTPPLLLFSHKNQGPHRHPWRGKPQWLNDDNNDPPWLTNDCEHPWTETGDNEPRWARSPRPQKLISLTGNPGATSTVIWQLNNDERCSSSLVCYGTMVSNPPLMFVPTHLAETQDEPRWEAHLPPPLTPLTWHPGATSLTATWQPNNEQWRTSIIHCHCVFGHQLISGHHFDGEYWRCLVSNSYCISIYMCRIPL